MGATNSAVSCDGDSIKEAYDKAVESAVYNEGHDIYNGTISTTEGFKEVECPEGWVEFSKEERYKFLDELWERDDCEKWGPALGFSTPEGAHIFVFWAAM